VAKNKTTTARFIINNFLIAIGNNNSLNSKTVFPKTKVPGKPPIMTVHSQWSLIPKNPPAPSQGSFRTRRFIGIVSAKDSLLIMVK
jgi:hypothetical protein